MRVSAMMVLAMSACGPGQDERRLRQLADESEAVYVAVVEEIQTLPADRRPDQQLVKYRVEETFKGLKVEFLIVEFRLVEGPETEESAGQRVLSKKIWPGPGARHILFLRQVRYGPAASVATEDPYRASEARPEWVEMVRKHLAR
jgi:hypothetical protein